MDVRLLYTYFTSRAHHLSWNNPSWSSVTFPFVTNRHFSTRTGNLNGGFVVYPLRIPTSQLAFVGPFFAVSKTDKVLNPACTEPQEGNWAPGYLQRKWFQLRTFYSQSTPSTHPRIITCLSPAMTKSPWPFWFSSPVSSRYLSRITSDNPIAAGFARKKIGFGE